LLQSFIASRSPAHATTLQAKINQVIEGIRNNVALITNNKDSVHEFLLKQL
jgi:hypothetical protein